VAEIVARCGLDWLLIDLEHGTAEAADLLPMLLATGMSDTAALVRVESGERIRIGRALDLGAQGIMVPQVHSAEQARQVARWMRTQPSGERGIALFTRGMDFGSLGHAGVARRHEDLICIVQIESQAAVEAADEIAGVEGVDVLFVGPADLTHALGIPGQIDDPAYRQAVARVGQAARSAGKAAGVLVWNPTDVGGYAAEGFTFFSVASEVSILDKALRAGLDLAQRAVRPPIEAEI